MNHGTDNLFSTQPKAHRHRGSSEDDEDDVVLFREQLRNVGFGSDDEDAAHHHHHHHHHLPTAAAPAPAHPHGDAGILGAFTVQSSGAVVPALCAEAIGTGFGTAMPQAGTSPVFMQYQSRGGGDGGGGRNRGASGRSQNLSHPSFSQPSLASSGDGNTYSAIVNPPTNADPLYFRRFYHDDDEMGPLAASGKSVEELMELEPIPAEIRAEESAGIFVGQLPSSYSEADIRLLLKSLARLSDFPVAGGKAKRYMEIRDVKCHARDKTCAFIMINASSLLPILDFSKRALCDVHCVFICTTDRKEEINNFVSKFPRDMLKGVPKAALVLEKLTPQARGGNRNSNSNPDHNSNQHNQHQQNHQQLGSPMMVGGGGYMGMNPMFGAPNMGYTAYGMSPLGGRVPNPSAPSFVPGGASYQSFSVTGGSPSAHSGMFVASNSNLVSPMAFAGQHQSMGMIGLANFPGAMGTNMPSPMGAAGNAAALQGMNAAFLTANNPVFGGGGGGGASTLNFPAYLGTNTSIAAMEAANQALIASSRTRQTSVAANEANKNQTDSSGRTAPTGGTPDAASPAPGQLLSFKTNNAEDGEDHPRSPNASTSSKSLQVSLASTLTNVKCSCGHELMLSQIPAPPEGESAVPCQICKKNIDAIMVICYTCPGGHIAVCSRCGLDYMQKLRDKKEKETSQHEPKPRFTLVGLDASAFDVGSQKEGSNGDTASTGGMS